MGSEREQALSILSKVYLQCSGTLPSYHPGNTTTSEKQPFFLCSENVAFNDSRVRALST